MLTRPAAATTRWPSSVAETRLWPRPRGMIASSSTSGAVDLPSAADGGPLALESPWLVLMTARDPQLFGRAQQLGGDAQQCGIECSGHCQSGDGLQAVGRATCVAGGTEHGQCLRGAGPGPVRAGQSRSSTSARASRQWASAKASRSIGARPRRARRGDRPRRDRAATSPWPTMRRPVRSAHPIRSKPALAASRAVTRPSHVTGPPRTENLLKRAPRDEPLIAEAAEMHGRELGVQSQHAPSAPARTRCSPPRDGRGRARRRCRRRPPTHQHLDQAHPLDRRVERYRSHDAQGVEVPAPRELKLQRRANAVTVGNGADREAS